ncbi:putative acyl-CoA transferase/carnitine dehydratase [SAR116 cluster alpha proteobacterium HIMB100]|nr:putative acyl-CoA transferase/carnitine dehydratase [SAR116 cluster alpha proteobacterium HIMB100]
MGFESSCPILDHITVLDLTRVRSGPTCVRQLADWGANVIKIETPSDAGSDMGGTRDSSDFQNLQRNKRSMVLDLKSEAGKAIFLKMAAGADVIVENYRPDVKHRLGIDYETIKAFNPGIVYASISGFGQDGPLSKRPGFDQIAQGMGGLMSITGAPGEGPMRVGIPIADLTAGGFAAQGVLLALIGREKTGDGQWVQTSLLQAQIAMLDFQATRWLMDGHVPQQAGNNHPTSIPTGVFETRDGFINIAVAGQHIWLRFKDEIGDQRLDDEAFATPLARSENRDALSAIINDNFGKDTSQNWIERLNKIGVPSGEINTIDKVFESEQVQHLGIARDMMSSERGPVQVVGQPIIMSNADPSIQRPPPGKGEHSREILAEYGYSEADIQAFSDEGVI